MCCYIPLLCVNWFQVAPAQDLQSAEARQFANQWGLDPKATDFGMRILRSSIGEIAMSIVKDIQAPLAGHTRVTEESHAPPHTNHKSFRTSDNSHIIIIFGCEGWLGARDMTILGS